VTTEHEVWLILWMIKALDLIAYKGKDKSDFMLEMQEYIKGA